MVGWVSFNTAEKDSNRTQSALQSMIILLVGNEDSLGVLQLLEGWQ